MTAIRFEAVGAQPASGGRDSEPVDVRVARQRQRLLDAAAAEFADRGYADTGAESISRRAGMSKATFYEHFANKDDCILALFDTATETVRRAIRNAAQSADHLGAVERLRAGTRAFLTLVAEHHDYAQTLLVVTIGASPEAMQRRDRVVEWFADIMDEANQAAAKRGLVVRFASRYEKVAVAGAITELVSRQIRLGDPEDVLELAPAIDRMLAGLLSVSPTT